MKKHLTFILAIILSFCSFQERTKIELEIANKAYDGGNYEKAVILYTNILEVAPNNENVLFFRGSAFYRLEQYDKSVLDYKKVLKVNPQNKFARCLIGSAKYNLHEIDSALYYLNKAIEFDSLDYEAYSNLGFVMEELNKNNEALKYYEKAIEVFPGFLSVRFNKSKLLHKLGKNKIALAEIDSVITINQSNPINYKLRAEINLSLDNVTQACIDFNKVLELGDSSVMNEIEKYCN